MDGLQHGARNSHRYPSEILHASSARLRAAKPAEAASESTRSRPGRRASSAGISRLQRRAPQPTAPRWVRWRCRRTSLESPRAPALADGDGGRSAAAARAARTGRQSEDRVGPSPASPRTLRWKGANRRLADLGHVEAPEVSIDQRGGPHSWTSGAVYGNRTEHALRSA